MRGKLAPIAGASRKQEGARSSSIYSQFKDKDHLVLVLEGIVQVDQLAVVQVVHDVDLLPDQRLF